jgi:hypothetical protein
LQLPHSVSHCSAPRTYFVRPEGLYVDHRVQEEFPSTVGASSAQTLASGTLHSVLHPTEGTATVYRMGDGNRVLRFTNFKTSNGPDVHIYMVAITCWEIPATICEGLQQTSRHPRRSPGYRVTSAVIQNIHNLNA